MNISDAARAARKIADTSIDPFDHARANALEANAPRNPVPAYPFTEFRHVAKP
jgi:hypothetical protein